MRYYILLLLTAISSLSSCRENRVHEHKDWNKYFDAYGIKDACIMIRDNNHEAVDYYNKERCLQRFTPASTFKIFNSLVALETATVPDEHHVIKWNGVPISRDTCNKDMTMREAFRVSCINYYQEIARRIGKQTMQFYLDTVRYGNMKMGNTIDAFWVDSSLQISADEQLGFIKRLYFNELPFTERSQRIVRSMMVWEDTHNFKLSYKTGTGERGNNYIYWIVGYAERIDDVKEHEKSMNKSNVRQYPYFFAINFEAPKGDTKHDYFQVRLDILHKVLKDFGAMPK